MPEPLRNFQVILGRHIFFQDSLLKAKEFCFVSRLFLSVITLVFRVTWNRVSVFVAGP